MHRRTVIGGLAGLAVAGSAQARDAVARERLFARPRTPGEWVLAGGSHKARLDRRRDATLMVSPKLDRAVPAPLLVVLKSQTSGGNPGMASLYDEARVRGVVVLTVPSRGEVWETETVAAEADAAFVDRSLAWCFANARIDPARIGVAGFSDGAARALSLGVGNGDLFTDVLAFSATGDRVGAPVGQPRMYICHGVRDRVAPFAEGQAIADRFREKGYDVSFTGFDGGHEVPARGGIIGVRRLLSGRPALAEPGSSS